MGVQRRRCRGRANRVPGAVKDRGTTGTDSDVVYEHLVEAMGAEAGADNVCDGDCCLDVLVADFLARDALAVTEQSDRLAGVACKERHACGRRRSWWREAKRG